MAQGNGVKRRATWLEEIHRLQEDEKKRRQVEAHQVTPRRTPVAQLLDGLTQYDVTEQSHKETSLGVFRPFLPR
jgi:hypothetical protein